MANKIKKVEVLVEKSLRENPKTREDDNKLYLSVINQIAPEKVIANFLVMFERARENGLPAYETITRCRRKLQEKYVELRAEEIMQKKRDEQEMNMFEYSLERSNK